MAEIKPSLIDRILSEIAPGFAAGRLASKHDYKSIQAGGYAGAMDYRYRTNQAYNRSRPGTEDKILGPYDRRRLRLECRDLWRNNEIVRGINDRFEDYAIWKGIRPQARTSNPEWNAQAEAWWNEIYYNTVDHRQIRATNMTTLQKLLVSHRVIDGELGFILLANGQIQAIEADRIDTPTQFKDNKNIVEGIKRSASGVITGYYVCDRKDGGSVDCDNFRFIRRENFLHCYKPGRVDQLRGIPDLAPAIAKLRDYDETDTFILNKVKLDSEQQFKLTKNNNLLNTRGRDAYQDSDSNSQNPQKVVKQDWGTIHQLGLNEDMEAFESKTPNSQYVPYLKHELQAIAAALNLPYEMMMLIFTQGSFSSSRAALIHARHTFTSYHDWVIQCFLTPLWNWRIAKAMKEGTLEQAPTSANGMSEWWRVDWSMNFFDWIDPQKQTDAEIKQFNMGTKSLSSIARTQGKDINDELKGKAGDIQMAIEQAEALNSTNNEANVTWRDLINTGVPGVPTAPEQTSNGAKPVNETD
jgi:lambda family phage portal protein